MRLSEVQAREKVCTAHWDGEDVDVCYRPSKVTPAMLANVLDMVKDGNSAASAEIESVPALLEPILVWWDVLDDNDERLPTDAKTIRSMPMSFLSAVVAATQEDMKPGKAES